MKVEEKYLVIGILITIFFTAMFSLTYEIKKSAQSEIKISALKESPNIVGRACVSKNNKLLGCTYNLITNSGEEHIEDTLFWGNGGIVDYLVLGNTTAPVEGSTSHPGEYTDCGLTRSQATPTDNGNGNVTLSYTWSSITCTRTVNTTGALNASSGGTYFAGTTITTASVTSNDNLTIEYTFWVAEEA